MTTIKPNAETFRIRALSYLATKQLSQARLEIQKAAELEPSRESVRVAAAMIDYFSALTPVAITDRIVQWPPPVDWTLVNRDDESLLRLREAAKVFRALLQDKTKDKEIQRIFESWLLACLANDPEGQEEAVKYAQKLLQSDATHYRALAWIVARNFSINLKPSEKALSKIVKKSTADVPQILALASLYFLMKKGTKATTLLEQSKQLFQEQGASSSWLFWYSQALVTSGNAEKAVTEIDKSGLESELRHAKTIALRAIALKSNEWHALFDHLETSYRATGDPTYLLELCGTKALKQDWEYVAERAVELVQKISTTEVLRLVTLAAFNAKRYNLCLLLLEKYRNLFAEQKLPSELRKIRIMCQRSVGHLPAAITEAEGLVQEEPTTEHLINLGTLYAEIGDIGRLSSIAGQLAGQPDLTPEQAIWLGRLVLVEDRDLAVTLWKKAISLDLPDALVGEALSLGYQLGCDQDLGPLMARMAELGRQGRGGIQMASIHDLVDIAKRNRDRDEKLAEFYKQATGPIHIIARQVNRPLVELYHGFLLHNEDAPDPTRQFYLLARHGGRNLVQGFPKRKPEWRLNIDVTSLLLGEHLQILDKVLQAFRPLRIMGDLVPLLLQMRDKIIPHQPSRLAIYQQIDELADAKALEIADCQLPINYENQQLINEMGNEWVAILEEARVSNGYLVDFLPLHKRDLTGEPTALPEDADQHIITCRSIVEALRTQGPLSEKEYHEALRRLGDEGRKEAGSIIPKEGYRLYLSKNTPEVLAEANLLRVVCERFKAYIELSEIQRVRAELREYKRRKEISEWMTRLIEKLNKGITRGDYELVHLQPAKVAEANKEYRDDLENRNLFAMMSIDTQDSDVIWIDDRYLNSFGFFKEKARTIDICEILKALVSAGALDKKEYYAKMQQLRRANIRFIPVQKDEILYHLNQAVIIDNEKLVETQELIDMKRYIAACLMQNDILQRPPMPDGAPNKTGEVVFVLGLGRAIVDALIAVWDNAGEDVKTRVARSEWLLNNLYLDHLALRNVISMPQADQEDRYVVGLSLAGLLSQALSITTKNKEVSVRKEYFDWLYYNVLKKRFDADSSLLVASVDNLKKLLLSVRDKPVEKDSDRIVVYLLQKYYEDLPESIRDELMRDTDFMANIGFRPQPNISVGDLRFVPEAFWKAAGEAVNGRVSKITPIESNVDVIFEPAPKDKARGAFKFIHPVSGKEAIVQREELELLIDSPSLREATLRRNRYWFDCPDEVFNQVVADIVSQEDGGKRIEKVKFWQSSSAAYYYENLKKQIISRRDFSLQDLLPLSAEGLLRHFRFTEDIGAGIDFRTALTEAAQTLIVEEGMQSAIDRLIGFPTPIPTALLEPILKLEPKDKDILVHNLLMTPGSPLSRVHLVKVLLHISEVRSKYARLARKLVRRLISKEGVKEINAFIAALKWTNEEFGYWPSVRKRPPHIRLALVWSHAHRLYSCFEAANAPVDWIRYMFTNSDRKMPHEIFERSSDYWFDIAHPRFIDHANLLIGGLFYSIGNEASKLIDERITALISEIAFQSYEGVRVPSLPLLRYAVTTSNSLDSFLGGDYGVKLSSLLDMPEASMIRDESLKKTVEQAVKSLGDDKYNTNSWAQLYAIVGEVPLFEGIGYKINQLIINTDIVTFYKKNWRGSLFVIQLAGQQIIKTKDKTLSDYLKGQITKLAEHLAEDSRNAAIHTESDARSLPEDIGGLLLEAALNISIREESSDSVMSEFVRILTELINAWQPMIGVCKPVVQRLCEELPVSQANQFWQLLIKLRAK